VYRPRLQPGQANLVQPFADRAFPYRHTKAARNLVAQIHAAPAHHLVDCGVRTRNHQIAQLGHLRLGQFRLWAGGGLRYQAC